MMHIEIKEHPISSSGFSNFYTPRLIKITQLLFE